MTWTRRIVLIAMTCLLVGCPLATSPIAVPPAQVAVTKRWQYVCFALSWRQIQETANKLGAQGWELATVKAGDHWCFKRPY